DLSKIESGTVTVEAEDITFQALRDTVERSFHHLAESKNLGFHIDIDNTLPKSFTSDPKRLQQILKNLLSNAFKFTSLGHVSMRVKSVTGGWSPDHPILRFVQSAVAIEVSDTGIGIALEKQRLIFEAFQQADAGTSRKYGGTGLGLAISRELASLLGGEIQLRSAPGEGSTFTLYLPQTYVGPVSGVTVADIKALSSPTPLQLSTAIASERSTERFADDRENLQRDDAILLIVEDDPYYARMLVDLAHDKGFKALVAMRGAEALALAREFQPTAVSLDVFLPDMLGWTVLNHFKQDSATRHIPVQMLTLDEDRQHGLGRGGFAYVSKPSSPEELETAFTRIKEYSMPRRKRLLVVEDNPAEQLSIRALLGYDDIDVEIAASGTDAIAAITGQPFDCVVRDLRLPDMSGF